MDPIAHTLVGAALAETGLKRLSRYATATLIIGANLPDIDIVAMFWSFDHSLYYRRGWTHGILAMLLLPLMLVGAIALWHRWRGRRVQSDESFRPSALLALAFLAICTHPFLDWLNTYGVRLLMPFDERWFYGDTLFIIDPWLWLLAAAGVVIACSKTWPSILAWLLLAVAITVLMFETEFATREVKTVWLIAIAVMIALRWRMISQAATATIARFSVAMMMLYIGVVYGMARTAENIAAERHPTPMTAQSNPVFGQPSSQRLVLVYQDHYRVIRADGGLYEVPRKTPDAIVEQAMASESINGFVEWMRFPYWQVKETPDSFIVSFWDLRYQGPDEPERGIGFAEVAISKAALDQAQLN